MTALAREHFGAIRAMLAHLLHHRRLTWEMAKRDVTEKYAGQALGTIWAVGHPLALMGVYIFMFAYVLKVKIGGTRDMPLDFTTYLLSGLIPWLAIQDAMSKGVNAVTGSANLVKQVVFPLEILPLKGIFASMLTQLIASALLIFYVLANYGTLPWTFALLPVVWLLEILFVGGICYILASIGAYFRDLKDFVQVFCVVGVYIMPTIYLPAWVPNKLRPLIYANPFSHVIWCFQDVCYFGRIEHPYAWVVFGVMSGGLFYVGYRTFHRLKVGFGSVL